MNEQFKLQLLPIQDGFVFDKARYCGLGGGWGNGKTTAGCIKAIHLCNRPGNVGLIGRETVPELEDTTLTELFKLMPQWEKYYNKNRKIIRLPNGSVIYCRHLAEWKKLSNYNLGWFFIDQAEDIDSQCYIWLKSRIRLHDEAQGFVTFNMAGHDYLWEEFKKNSKQYFANEYTKASYKEITEVCPRCEGKGCETCNYTGKVTYQASLYEGESYVNQANLPTPYLVWLKTLPEGVSKRYVKGSWDYFAGQIYADFDERIHEIEPFEIPHYWEIFRTMDYGYQEPNVCLWVAVSPRGDVFIIDELYQAGKPPSWHKRAIDLMTGRRIISATFGCPRFFQTESQGKKVADEYREEPYSIYLQPMPISVFLRIQRVIEYMQVREDHIVNLPDGRVISPAPRWFMFKGKCPHLKEELLTYAWKRVKDFESPGDERLKEEPRDVNNHAIEAMERLIGGYLWNPPEWQPEPEKTFADRLYEKIIHRRRGLKRVV